MRTYEAKPFERSSVRAFEHSSVRAGFALITAFDPKSILTYPNTLLGKAARNAARSFEKAGRQCFLAEALITHDFGLSIFLFGDERLGATLINLRGSYFVSHTDCQASCVIKILVCLTETGQVAEDVAEIVLYVSAKDSVAS